MNNARSSVEIIYPQKPKLLGFENESIIVNEKGKPVNRLDNGKLLIDELLKILSAKGYKKLIEQQYIKPELDACQFEICNVKPHSCVDDAIEELQYLFSLCEEVVTNDMGLHILQTSVPAQSFAAVHTGKKPHYGLIDSETKKYNVRNNANIAGLHFNFFVGDNLPLYAKTANHVAQLLYNKDFTALLATEKRIKLYAELAEALNKSDAIKNYVNVSRFAYEPTIFDQPDNPEHISTTLQNSMLINEDGDAAFSYEFTRLKKGRENYIGEVRVHDAGFSQETIKSQAEGAYELFLLAQEQKHANLMK